MDDETTTTPLNATNMPATDKVLPKGLDMTQLMQVAQIAQQKQSQLESDIILIKRALITLDDRIKEVLSLLKKNDSR